MAYNQVYSHNGVPYSRQLYSINISWGGAVNDPGIACLLQYDSLAKTCFLITEGRTYTTAQVIATAPIQTAAALPVRFRPAVEVDFPMSVMANDVSHMSLCVLGTDGILSIAPDYVGNTLNFTTGETASFRGIRMFYKTSLD